VKDLRDLEDGGEFLSAPTVVLPRPEMICDRLVGTTDSFEVAEALEIPCLMIEKLPDGLGAYSKCRERQQPVLGALKEVLMMVREVLKIPNDHLYRKSALYEAVCPGRMVTKAGVVMYAEVAEG